MHLATTVIAEGIVAYPVGSEFYLPLGQLMQGLNFAIEVDASARHAHGWFIREGRDFSLDGAGGRAHADGNSWPVNPESLVTRAGDLYVPMHSVSQWLPLDLDVDRAGLILHVRPREPIPLQAQLERQRIAGQLASGSQDEAIEDRGYPRRESPYEWAGLPLIDQSVGFGATRPREGVSRHNFSYSTYAAGDLALHSGELILNGSDSDPFQTSRLTLGRADPDAKLLGPLRAREYHVGSASLEGKQGISRASSNGFGVTVSSRPFTFPSRFDSQTLTGNLPSGWDALLLRNGTAYRYQSAREDGRYRFEDLPLVFGENDYRVILSGPRGEERIETYRYLLDAKQVRPGDVYYDFGTATDRQGGTRTQAQVDAGLTKNISVSATGATLPVSEERRAYGGGSVRAFLPSLFLNADLVGEGKGGALGELDAKTRLGDIGVSLSRMELRKFESELFPASDDPLRSRSIARLDFSLPTTPRLPMSLEGRRDVSLGGTRADQITSRVSAYILGTSVTTDLTGQSNGSQQAALASLVLSRRVGGLGIRGETSYDIYPAHSLQAVGAGADIVLNKGYSINQGLNYALAPTELRYGIELNKKVGDFGAGASLGLTSRGETSAGLRLFAMLGVDPRTGSWVRDAQPGAQTGAVSAVVFEDRNYNGVFDPDEPGVSGVAFMVDGMRQETRTNEKGVVFIDHLPVRQWSDVGIDAGTIPDFNLSPFPPGLRLLARPGHTEMLEFPLVRTIEIDGIAMLADQDLSTRAQGVELELVGTDSGARVVGRTKTGSDGFFVFTAVPPGSYELRINSDQAKRVGLSMGQQAKIDVKPGSDYINGWKVEIQRLRSK